MIREIEQTLQQVRSAIVICEEIDTLNILYIIENMLKNIIHTYTDDGK
jgi:hypothetical protein